jgi:prevent-host-death family protein
MIKDNNMPVIKPISDLRNNFNLISDICHKNNEPVFITKNGEGSLVVMSIAAYEKQQDLINIYQLLGEAEIESNAGIKKNSHKDIINRLRNKLNE